MMRLDEFQDFLDIHGADRRRWPVDLRPAADALVTASPDAARLLLRAQELDDALILGRAGRGAPANLRTSILSIPREGRRPARLRALPWVAGTAALAASLLLGLALGPVDTVPAPSDEPLIDLAVLAYGPTLEPDELP